MEVKHNNCCSLECMLFEQNRQSNATSTEKVKSKKTMMFTRRVVFVIPPGPGCQQMMVQDIHQSEHDGFAVETEFVQLMVGNHYNKLNELVWCRER